MWMYDNLSEAVWLFGIVMRPDVSGESVTRENGLYLQHMGKRINIISVLLMVPVYLYKWFISPLKGPSCRHVPSCSTYSIDALRRHGPWHGLRLGTNRILRCRPGGTHGYDPVPKILIKRYRPLSTRVERWKSSNRLKQH
jgi:uncharacterized protein